jgi:uncharacterized FlgJ-related protein
LRPDHLPNTPRAYNFQTGNNIVPLFREYENAIKKFDSLRNNIFSYIFILRKHFLFIASDLKITGHGNPDNNSESPCTFDIL